MVPSIFKMTLTTLLISVWLAASAIHPNPLNAILCSGDGQSPATAFHTSNTNEQYMVLQHFGMNPDMHALELVSGNLYDVYLKGETKIYFTNSRRKQAI